MKYNITVLRSGSVTRLVELLFFFVIHLAVEAETVSVACAETAVEIPANDRGTNEKSWGLYHAS